MPADFGSFTQADYIYSIFAAYTGISQAAKSQSLILEVDDLSDIEENISVYPNPTLGEVTISWEHSYPKGLILHIYNAAGAMKRVMEVEADRMEVRLDIAEYPQGMYVIGLIDANTRQLVDRIKLVKLK
jgi:hypothetical protein